MAQMCTEVSVVLDPDTFHVIETLRCTLATVEYAGDPAHIAESLKVCYMLLSQYYARHPQDQIKRTDALRTLCYWRETKAKTLISSNLSQHVHIAEIAKECSLSRSHFSRAFKHSTGVSPKEWLITNRIRRAKEMLLGLTVPLAAIAVECGFSDQSHFTRTFSKHVGVSPKKWREHMINTHSSGHAMGE